MLYEGTDWGQSSAQYAEKFFPEMGCKLLLEESYVSGMSDFTPQILKMKATKPDLPSSGASAASSSTSRVRISFLMG